MKSLVALPRTQRLALATVCCMAALTGCMGTGGTLPLEAAHVSFANDGKASGLPGAFRSVDGKPLSGNPVTITVEPGSRVIGYVCPDTITMDGPPTVAAEFLPGKSYLLACSANTPATITERKR